MGAEEQKRAAARRAVEAVQDGMLVGLGSGTTAEIAIALLGERFQSGLHFHGVPTSSRSGELAASFGIPLVTLDEHESLDVAVDGADEVDPHLNCLKGHGGQLLREKIVATSARRFIVIVDSTKRVQTLGERSPIPIEVIPFGWKTTERRLEALGFECELRGGGAPYITAGQNYILDCRPRDRRDLADPALADAIKRQVGVVEHGLFLGTARSVVYGLVDGDTDVVGEPIAAAA